MDGTLRRSSPRRFLFVALATLWSASVARAEPASAQTFPRSGPRGDASAGDFALPLPRGWSLEAFETDRRMYSDASVPVVGQRCVNHVWFDFVPAVTLEYAKRLVDTESLDVTTAIRHWYERQYGDTRLAGHTAVVLRFPEAHLAVRSIYLVPGGGGVLVIQIMAMDEAPLECVGAHPKLAGVLVSSFFSPAAIAKAAKLSATRSPPPLREVEPVPRNLEECFEALEKLMTPEDLETFRTTAESGTAVYHLTLGMGLRNRWGLWSSSPLAKYFEAIGVFHPDDMSGIILTSFWRHLNGRPLEVEQQVASYRKSWEARKPPTLDEDSSAPAPSPSEPAP